jgi:hypothetical protein
MEQTLYDSKRARCSFSLCSMVGTLRKSLAIFNVKKHIDKGYSEVIRGVRGAHRMVLRKGAAVTRIGVDKLFAGLLHFRLYSFQHFFTAVLLESHAHCKEIWIYVFPEKELRGLSPNFHIHVSVSDSYPRPTYFPAAE